jgi:hypothetical protein
MGERGRMAKGRKILVVVKEVIKEQPTPTNLSARARRVVLQCTRSQ